ncbi:chemotaxis protein CheW [Roseateles sp. BYS96W]|uniref:Chemotaxis protein CheW n=1 Tax=Pelomonas nitida TaxID=3299027 RepID=A0ABW7G2Y7_9BURK
MAGTSDAWVLARLGGWRLAIPADAVEGAQQPAAPLLPLPRHRGPLAGLLATDAGVVPVVDLPAWVQMPEPDDAAAAPASAARQEVLILRRQQRRIGVRVDELLGVRRASATELSRLHQRPDPDELFDGVLQPRDGSAPAVVLEPGRLMDLIALWAEAAGLDAATAATGAAPAPQATAPEVALFRVAGAVLAISPAHVHELLPMPALGSVLGSRGATRGFAAWRGRMTPVVDAPWLLDQPAGAALPALAVALGDATGRQILLGVDALLGTVPQPPAGSIHSAGPAWRGAPWAHDGTLVQPLDVPALLDALPESRLAAGAPPAARAATATNEQPHLVLQAGTSFAMPLADVLTIIDDGQLNVAQIAWQGRQYPIHQLAADATGPLLALMEGTAGRLALRVQRLVALLPAHAAERMPVPGQPGKTLLTAPHLHASYVVKTANELAAQCSAP